MKDDELLETTFRAIEYPESVYKTSRDIEIAGFSSILTFLLIVVTIYTCQILDSFQFLLLLGLTLLVLVLSLCFFASSLISFINAEFNRKQNSVLFANSILAKESDNSFSHYQIYNIRVLRTHAPKWYSLYAILIAMGISLFVIQIIVDSSSGTLSDNMLLLFGYVVSGTSFSTITFTSLVIFAIGSLGLVFRIFSDVNITRWNSKSETQIHDEAKRLIATVNSTVEMTYEQAVKVFKDAEYGFPAALVQKDLMTEGVSIESARFKKVRSVFILLIMIVTIIDVIVIFLLP